jgi:hypothetical protein
MNAYVGWSEGVAPHERGTCYPVCSACRVDPHDDHARWARDDGRATGHAAGAWAINSTITEQDARDALTGIREGDFDIMDRFSSGTGWLSGEWADQPTPATLARDADCDDPDCIDALCDAFELAADEAYWNEIERALRYYAGEEA